MLTLASRPETAYNIVMNADSFHQLLEALAKRNPFRPFTVKLLSGDRFEVDHARALVERDGVAVFLAPGGIPIWFDHESVAAIVGDTAGTSA
ncbi:MAG: hypothetical protein ACHRHE_12840 [Tepidisphaerales bacterium]